MKKTLASTAVALFLACGAADANTLDYLRDFNPSEDFDRKNFYLGLSASNADIDGIDGAGNNVMAYVSAGAGVRMHSNAVDADSTAGIAAAFGLNLFGTDKTAINFEYLYLGGNETSTSTGIGFHHYFGKY